MTDSTASCLTVSFQVKLIYFRLGQSKYLAYVIQAFCGPMGLFIINGAGLWSHVTAHHVIKMVIAGHDFTRHRHICRNSRADAADWLIDGVGWVRIEFTRIYYVLSTLDQSVAVRCFRPIFVDPAKFQHICQLPFPAQCQIIFKPRQMTASAQDYDARNTYRDKMKLDVWGRQRSYGKTEVKLWK